MSTRKGNNKKRGQKHQNTTTFKNNLHDTSKTTKTINNLLVQGVCERCRSIIEWKKKYKKYKPLTTPKKCVKCEQKTIKHAYHTICVKCGVENNVCEKCGMKVEDLERCQNEEESSKNSFVGEQVKFLSERQRRTFFRTVDKGLLAQDALFLQEKEIQ